MEQEAENSYFSWEPVLAKVTSRLDRGGVWTVVGFLNSAGDRYAHHLAPLCKRLRELGDAHGAWTLAEQALKASKNYGWMVAYDGGSRLAALTALVDADPSKGRPLVYKRLVGDLTGDFPYPQEISRSL